MAQVHATLAPEAAAIMSGDFIRGIEGCLKRQSDRR